MVFNFGVSGSVLNRTVTMGPLLAIPIEDGTVTGNQISFNETIRRSWRRKRQAHDELHRYCER